jgi:hypothetical protein
LLVETDCPFLAPQHRRGGRNEPAYCREVLERIALARGLPPDDQKKAIRLGMAGAYLFRVLALLAATWLISNTWVRWLGAGYLIYLMASHLCEEHAVEEADGTAGSGEKRRRQHRPGCARFAAERGLRSPARAGGPFHGGCLYGCRRPLPHPGFRPRSTWCRRAVGEVITFRSTSGLSARLTRSYGNFEPHRFELRKSW